MLSVPSGSVVEPRSLPELIAARASGGLAGEELFDGLTYAHLADPSALPEWLRFLHDPDPLDVRCERGIAVIEPLTLLIGARALARALSLHEHDRVAMIGDLSSMPLRLGGIGAAVYAGSTLVAEGDQPTVTVSEESVMIGSELLFFTGWPETCWLCSLSSSPGELGQLLDRMEPGIDDGELVVRGPLMMSGYRDDPAATEAAFGGGWFHTRRAATRGADGTILLA
jgi:hypothetical protein